MPKIGWQALFELNEISEYHASLHGKSLKAFIRDGYCAVFAYAASRSLELTKEQKKGLVKEFVYDHALIQPLWKSIEYDQTMFLLVDLYGRYSRHELAIATSIQEKKANVIDQESTASDTLQAGVRQSPRKRQHSFSRYVDPIYKENDDPFDEDYADGPMHQQTRFSKRLRKSSQPGPLPSPGNQEQRIQTVSTEATTVSEDKILFTVTCVKSDGTDFEETLAYFSMTTTDAKSLDKVWSKIRDKPQLGLDDPWHGNWAFMGRKGTGVALIRCRMNDDEDWNLGILQTHLSRAERRNQGILVNDQYEYDDDNIDHLRLWVCKGGGCKDWMGVAERIKQRLQGVQME